MENELDARFIKRPDELWYKISTVLCVNSQTIPRIYYVHDSRERCDYLPQLSSLHSRHISRLNLES